MAALLSYVEIIRVGTATKLNVMSANVKTIDVDSIMIFFSDAAPFLLMACAFLTFFITGVFQSYYYQDLLQPQFVEYAQPMAIVIACITELVRFSLLVASVRDFSDSRKFNGWLGICVSLALVFHDISVSQKMAELWANGYSSMLIFLVVIGLVLEIRLVLTVAKPKTKENLGKTSSILKAEYVN